MTRALRLLSSQQSLAESLGHGKILGGEEPSLPLPIDSPSTTVEQYSTTS